MRPPSLACEESFSPSAARPLCTHCRAPPSLQDDGGAATQKQQQPQREERGLRLRPPRSPPSRSSRCLRRPPPSDSTDEAGSVVKLFANASCVLEL